MRTRTLSTHCRTGRRRPVLALLLLAAAAIVAGGGGIRGAQLTRNTRQAICAIVGKEWGGTQRHLTGSVIFCNQDGSEAYALTNWHLWRGAPEPSVTSVWVGVPDDSWYEARAVFAHEATEVCVLRFAPGKALPYLTIADTDATQNLVIAGYPNATKNLVVTPCSVKATAGKWRILNAHTDSGHSGSPVLNSAEQLVGQVWGGDVHGAHITSLAQLRETFEAAKFQQFCPPGYSCPPRFIPQPRRPAPVQPVTPQPVTPTQPVVSQPPIQPDPPAPPPAEIDYDVLLDRMAGDPRFTPPTADQIAKKLDELGLKQVDTIALADAVKKRLGPVKIGLTDREGKVARVISGPLGDVVPLPPSRMERYDENGNFINDDVQVLGVPHKHIRRPPFRFDKK